MNISPSTQKKIDELDGLVKKHEYEIKEQKKTIRELENEIEQIENNMKNDFEDIYNSANYRRIWNDFKVDKSIAEKKIYFDNYKNPINYKNNSIESAKYLLKQANEKRDKRIAQILSILPKKTKSANFRKTLRSHRSRSRSNSKEGGKKRYTKGGRKRKTKRRR